MSEKLTKAQARNQVVQFDCAHTMTAKTPDGIFCCDCGRIFADRKELDTAQKEQESPP